MVEQPLEEGCRKHGVGVPGPAHPPVRVTQLGDSPRPRSSSLKVLLRLLLLFNGPLSLFLKTFASGLNCAMQDLFSFSEACGIIVPQPGIEPTFPALQGRFLTTGPAGKSLYMSFLHLLLVQRPI